MTERYILIYKYVKLGYIYWHVTRAIYYVNNVVINNGMVKETFLQWSSTVSTIVDRLL